MSKKDQSTESNQDNNQNGGTEPSGSEEIQLDLTQNSEENQDDTQEKPEDTEPNGDQSAQDLSQDNKAIIAELETKKTEIEGMQKRLDDKDTYINWLKDKINSQEAVVAKLTGHLEKFAAFFSKDISSLTEGEFKELKNSIPVIQEDFLNTRASAKLQSVKTSLDLTEEESIEVNRAFQRDGYTAEVINSMADKELQNYIRSIVDNKKRMNTPQVSSDVTALTEMVKQLAEQNQQLIVALSSKKTDAQDEPKIASKKGEKPTVLKTAPKITPSGKSSGGDDAEIIFGESRV